MNLPVETLFTAALGLQAPWEVKQVDWSGLAISHMPYT